MGKIEDDMDETYIPRVIKGNDESPDDASSQQAMLFSTLPTARASATEGSLSFDSKAYAFSCISERSPARGSGFPIYICKV